MAGIVPDELPTVVGVDMSALIYKIFARYPGEFTLFRELLQNSDDARSDTVEIYFETAPSESDIVQWIFKNNGDEFTPEDWTRLTKIAKGNTNPNKVGAFGVGFYSLFSVTDNPLVFSGSVGKEFYWTEDKAQLNVCPVVPSSNGTASPWTIFKIPLREPGPMLRTTDFMQFLATSITFMVHLKNVTVFLNGHPLGRISKFPGPTTTVKPPIEFKHSSPSEMMFVNSIECHQFTMQAEISSNTQEQSDMCSLTLATGNNQSLRLDLTIFTAEVNVRLNEKLSKNLLRCTSKEQPSQLKYGLVYTGKDEYAQSFVDQKNEPLMSVFQGLRADLDGASHPRIFIGHSTSQTTGIGGHMASVFIPTVERESLDFVDKYVSAWNSELLYVGGFLARTVYELELSAIQTSWEKATGSNTSKFRDLSSRFVHVLKFFTFYESIPSPKVAQLLQDAFYKCSASPLRLLSSVGVRHASDIRLFDRLCSEFLRLVPMLSLEITEVAQRIIHALPREHQIRAIMLSDVLQDLPERSLDKGELIAYLTWVLQGPTADIARLLEVASFSCADGTIIKLSTIRSFINPNGPGANIPQHGPMPPFLIPPEIITKSSSFTPVNLASLGWREFTIADWLRYISQPEIMSAHPEHDFLRSADWAERVLRTVSFAWSSSDEIRSLAKSIFENKKCIPIMRKLYSPEETYLPSWDFPALDGLDLQVVAIPPGFVTSGEMERLLVTLGVQQHLAPQLLLKQVVETAKWETSVLIDYLVQVADTLSLAEIAELKSYKAFAGVGGQNGTNRKRFCADELYPPTSTFKQLQLRTIEYKGSPEWRDTSPEAELMYRLGLRRHPPLEEIIKLCSQDSTVGKHAFDYLCDNLRSVYADYNPDKFRNRAFIPAVNTRGLCLEKLGEVYLDRQWQTLGLSVIRYKYPEIFEALGVQRDPPASSLLQLLKTKPPPNEEIARQWFEILSIHGSCFGQNERDTISQLRIVPKTISAENRKWLAPFQCYLGKSTKHELYSKLFHFVNFGDGANQFLRACGAKNEPSEEDVAELLAENHNEFYRIAGYQRFLQELCDIAARHTRISNSTICKLRSKAVLLGARREKTTNPDGWKDTYSLWKPNEIVIVDDVHTYQLFAESIVAAPQNLLPELENFYILLGCKFLTNVVRVECNPSGEMDDAQIRSEFEDLVKQRLLLFLRHYRPRTGTSAPSFPSTVTVRVCKHLSVSKILTLGDHKIVKERNVWATAAAPDEQGTIQVWRRFSDAKQDMYELAVSLCRVLLRAVHLNDALLLASILSEDLDVLKGRGYEVIQRPDDPVLTEMTKSCSSTAPKTPWLPSIDPMTQPLVTDAGVMREPTPSHSPGIEGGEAAPSSPTSSSEMSLPVAKFMSNLNFRDMFRVVTRSFMPSAGIEPCAPCKVMSRSYIQSTVMESIRACSSSPFCHRRDTDTTGFLKDGYCDVSAPIENLRRLGSIENVKVFASQGISNVDTFMERMQDQLTHFVRIITRVANIYDLPLGSLCIFYDTTTQCIAFNRKGILYLNLLYFEEWHYQDVKNGNSRRALSSWFLTLAHEIAHNLVEHHGSEHEFWFSAICEAYMDAFSQLELTGSPSCH